MPGPPRTLGAQASGLGAVLAFLCFSAALAAAPEFSGYLQKVLKNHTAHACDGEQLAVICPHKTSISILSAFYGRRVPSQNLCPSSGNLSDESTACVSATARQLLDECQDQRWCQFSVHSPVFGPDPCPGTHKYLIVSYKCRPANHRVKTVCENDKLTLQCRAKSVLAIYSASYGRPARGKRECDAANGAGPGVECLAPDALRRVFRQCHRRQNCTVVASKASFGDPCFPGARKQLRVSYTCVPRQLLEEVGQDAPDPFSLADYTHGGWYRGPRLARLREDLMIFTSSLETFAHLWGVPEKVGLYFLCGVSGGLVFLLCIFTPKMAFIQDMKQVFRGSGLGSRSELSQAKLRDDRNEDNHDDDSSSDSSFRHLTRAYRASDNIFSPELTAAMGGTTEHRAQEGEEIWMLRESSPYAIHKLKSATK
ncbi:protein eva-1 homolog C-like isoform X2 [Carettochelys insculpta]|uniref:protein eva-1 homolog C-like isoform X2 n=1 Tax=Carettochelys insculpta TaxID=44489 RepID=UPI003EBD0EDB